MTEDTVRIATLVATANAPETERSPARRARIAPSQQVLPSTPTPAPQRPPAPAMQETVAAVAKQIESYLRSVGRSLQFSVDEITGRTVVTVRDSETGELIRQIPGEETLRLARSLGNQPNALVDLTA